MDVVVKLKSGYSARGACSFKSGEAVAEFSVGSQGDWLLVAPGVEAVHLRLAFDGQDLYAASAAPHAPVRLANTALDGRWQRVAPPAELCFGGARLEITSGEGIAAEPPAVRLPRYFVEMVKSAPPVGALDGPIAPPHEGARGVRAAALAVIAVLALVTLVGLGVLRRQSRERAAAASSPATASAPAVVPLASSSSEPAAAAAPRAPLVAPVGPQLLPEAPADPLSFRDPAARLWTPPGTDQGAARPSSTEALAPGRAFPQNVADRPIPRVGSDPALISESWLAQHDRLLHAPRRAEARLVFLGDSITEAWRFAPAYAHWFGRYAPLDLGISGDHTQHLLWRLEHGEIDDLTPSVAVLMIGVNNLAGGFSPEHTVEGVRAVLAAVRKRMPDTFVIVLGILPARHEADDPLRQKIADANRLLAALAQPHHVEVHDLGARMLEADGTISKDIMRDYLHPTQAGYERLSDAVAPLVDGAMAGAAAPSVPPN